MSTSSCLVLFFFRFGARLFLYCIFKMFSRSGITISLIRQQTALSAPWKVVLFQGNPETNSKRSDFLNGWFKWIVFSGYPPGNDHISHQTGSLENHHLQFRALFGRESVSSLEGSCREVIFFLASFSRWLLSPTSTGCWQKIRNPENSTAIYRYISEKRYLTPLCKASFFLVSMRKDHRV